MDFRKFGLIGKNLSHSFSPQYFKDKWESEGVVDCLYQIFEIEDARELGNFLKTHQAFSGFNVTIPYKQLILPLLSKLSKEAEEIGAVNCIKFDDGEWLGHNTDGLAFFASLEEFIPSNFSNQALILGSGGASKAVQWALNKRKIKFDLVSSSNKGRSYEDINSNWDERWFLIINTSPVGMYPVVDQAPDLDYSHINGNTFVYDLIYNPLESEFLKIARSKSAKTKNGLEMLKHQADLSLDFWMKEFI
ncbi:MAG: shikimate dehydrogenase [Saprospiraceae bacterium]